MKCYICTINSLCALSFFGSPSFSLFFLSYIMYFFMYIIYRRAESSFLCLLNAVRALAVGRCAWYQCLCLIAAIEQPKRMLMNVKDQWGRSRAQCLKIWDAVCVRDGLSEELEAVWDLTLMLPARSKWTGRTVCYSGSGPFGLREVTLFAFLHRSVQQPSTCSYQHNCTASLLPWEHTDVSSCFVVDVRARVCVVAEPTSGFLFSSMRTVAPFVSFH